MTEPNTHIPLSEFLADIKSANWIKDNPQILDESSVARWVYLALKTFGRSVMEQYEEVVHIKNYRGNMPDNFANLNLAIYCEVDFVSVPQGTDLIKVQERLVAERLVIPEIRICENCEPIEDTTRCTERVVENLYMESTKRASINYKNFQYVKMGKDLVRNHCATDCVNHMVKDSPYSINIKGTTIYSTFKEGSLYTRYYGLPMDDEGLPVIPKTPNAWLEQYLEVLVKRKILEDGIMSKDLSYLQNMYGVFLQQELDLYTKAKADTSKIDMLALFRAIGTNRKRMQKYSINLGTNQSNYKDSYGGLGYGAWGNNLNNF